MRSYPFSDTKYLCLSSCFMGISSWALYRLKEYVLSFLLGVICFTSINHWRNYLENGWRQRIDISWVFLCALYIPLYTLYAKGEFQLYMGLSLLLCIAALCLYTYICESYWVVVHSTIHLYFSFFVPLLYIL
jgi:hypothetical protein